MPEIVRLLPSAELQTRDNIPVVTYSLVNTIRNKVLNYKDTVNSIFMDEEVSLVQELNCVNAILLHFKTKTMATYLPETLE